MTFLSMGKDTFKVPLELFQQNRQRLWKELLLKKKKQQGQQERDENDVDDVDDDDDICWAIVLQGGPSPLRYDTDHEPIFRQESFFWWLTGVKEPDCSVVLLYKQQKHKHADKDEKNDDTTTTTRTTTTTTTFSTILFIPKLPPSYATIMGKIKTLDEWKDIYQVDQVLYTNDLESFLESQLLTTTTTTTNNNNKKILLLEGRNTDSGNVYDMIPNIFLDDDKSKALCTLIDKEYLFPTLVECRVVKSDLEVRLMEYVTQITSFAHSYVMRNTKPYMMEYQCESLFRHYSYYNYGSRLQAYTSICGCGPNSAILHYGHAGEPNSRQLQPTDGCLFDMGAEYMGYASDVTCSFPANGTFDSNPYYRKIYEGVLSAQRAVYDMAKPGVSWVDCHKVAEGKILQALIDIGVVQFPKQEGTSDEDGNGNCNGDGRTTTIATTIEELVELRLGAVFMPHGLGHFIGIDTHDVGGYLLPSSSSASASASMSSGQNSQHQYLTRSTLPGLRSLRTVRTLQSNMVLTVEPGCYFIDHLLDEALNDPILCQYLNVELLSIPSSSSSSSSSSYPSSKSNQDEKEFKEKFTFRGMGGVRLEDVVVIKDKPIIIDTESPYYCPTKIDGNTDTGTDTDTGPGCGPGAYVHNLTLCPRTVTEIEHVMAGKMWPPTIDVAPELRRINLTKSNVLQMVLPSPPSN